MPADGAAQKLGKESNPLGSQIMEVNMGLVMRDGTKVTIEGVRRVSWDTGEMCEFASCLVSALTCLGDPIPYDYVMGTSGVAFRFTLDPGRWEFGNYGILNTAPDRYAPIRRAFAAVGYAHTLHEPGAFRDDAARIMDSIDRGIPVLAFGVVGPSDCCILTGYDEGGDVLLGWSTYQDIPDDHDIPPDVTGYFRKPGWHANARGAVLIGPKSGAVHPRTIYLDALRWAVERLRVQAMGPLATGLRGLEVWAQEMTDPQYFPTGDADTMGQRYVSTAINMTMLRDHCLAEPFLRRAIADVPEFEPELSQAVVCYGEVKRLRDGMDELIADNFSQKAMQAIADPEIRRRYAGAILHIRDAEDRAAAAMEALLRRCC